MGAYSTKLHSEDSPSFLWCHTAVRDSPSRLTHLEIAASSLSDSDSAQWRVRICGCRARNLTFHFDLEVVSPDGEVAFRLSRTLEEFQHAHCELWSSARGEPMAGLPDITALLDSPASSMKGRMQEICFVLQQWLDEVAEADLLPHRLPLQTFIGFPNRFNLWAAPGTPCLTMIAECHQPVLLEIASYLAGSSADLVNFLCLTSKTLSRQMSAGKNLLWRSAFGARWPVFQEYLDFQGSQENWREAYRQTLNGKRDYYLEVFDREKKLGFAMAAMPARITYDKNMNGFVAKYLSASEVLPESIPKMEMHRLRFCPPSARARLQPGFQLKRNGAEVPPGYPYKVLEGHDELVVGQGVELQWKMQYGSPFGWWYGHLEQLLRDGDGKLATATLTFRHFPSNSRWYRLEVRFGDNEMRPCFFGGYTGGIRAATPGEHKQWMRYFPKQPLPH